MTFESGDATNSARRLWRLVGLAFLLLAVAFGSYIRIHTGLKDPNFAADAPEGVMRSDPGFLYYLVERVIEGKGLPPADFRADPRVEHPLLTDLPALDAVSQEFPIAWSYLLWGGKEPLHVFSLWFMGIFASLTAVGVYFLVLEVSGKVQWACLGVALFSFLPASYWTIGFVLMREDFSFPFFALHLALLARAARVRTAGSMVLCALPLVAALASWHAMRFVVTLEVLCLFLWFLRTGENPFSARHSWVVPGIVAAASLSIPVLFRTAFVVSVPMRLAAGLLAAAALRRRGIGKLAAAGSAIGVVGGISLLYGAVTAYAGGDNYSHVWQLMLAKVLHLGDLPADPSAMSFEARMMWQGPFSTLPLGAWPAYFGAGLWLFLPALVPAAGGWVLGKGRAPECLIAAFAAIGMANAWLVERVMWVPAILLPVSAVLFLSRIRRQHWGLAAMVGALLGQGLAFGRVISHYRISWYDPPYVTWEYRALVKALPALVPENEAVMADPVVSTAILAHTRRPIVLLPKWEAIEARRRFHDFLLTFFHGTPEDLRRLLLNKYRSRYVLFDRGRLWEGTRYIAGIPLSQASPYPGTAAAWFLSTDQKVLESVPGFRLIYRSPPEIIDENGRPADLMRLYELTGDPGAPGPPGE
jgi:hypothetical protein